MADIDFDVGRPGALDRVGSALKSLLPRYEGVAGSTTSRVAGGLGRFAGKAATRLLPPVAIGAGVYEAASAGASALEGTTLGKTLAENTPGAEMIGRLYAFLSGQDLSGKSKITPQYEPGKPLAPLRLPAEYRAPTPDLGTVGPPVSAPGSAPPVVSDSSADAIVAARERLAQARGPEFKIDNPYDPNFSNTVDSIVGLARGSNELRAQREQAKAAADFQRDILKAQITGEYGIKAAQARAALRPQEHVVTDPKTLAQTVLRSNPDGTATQLQVIQPLPPGVTREQFDAATVDTAQKTGNYADVNAARAARGLPPLVPPKSTESGLGLVDLLKGLFKGQ